MTDDEKRNRMGQVRLTYKATYDCWVNMRQRCNNVGHPSYPDYGGRGIQVCPAWDSFWLFMADMGEAQAGLCLDRIDNDLGYCKVNCEWVMMAEQNKNKREQHVRKDNKTGIKGVGYRAKERAYIARGDAKRGTPLLYFGPSLENAVAARRAWEDQFLSEALA